MFFVENPMKPKEAPEKIVAFRLDGTHGQDLDRVAIKNKIVGIASGNQLARKLVLDFLQGRLLYPNPDDLHRNPNLA